MKLEVLEDLKTQRNLTNKEISELTGISQPTIGRIFNGQVEPSFENVAAIVRAIGGSLDELAGIHKSESQEIQALRREIHILRVENDAEKKQLESYEKVIGSIDRILEEKDKAAAYLKKMIRYFGIALAAMVVVFVGIVLFDIMHGGVGYIRYDELSNQTQEGMNVLLSALPDWLRVR